MPLTGSQGWYIELETNSGDVITIDDSQVLDEPTPRGSLNDFQRIEIPVPEDDRWFDEDLRRAQMRVWRDGERTPIERFERPVREPGRVVLQGRGGIELDKDVEFDVGSLENVDDVARNLVANDTPYVANVDAPDSGLRTSILQENVDTEAEWLDALLVNPATTDPWSITSEGTLRRHQTAWIAETIDDNTIRGNRFIHGPEEAYYWNQDTFKFDDTTINGAESGVQATFNLDYEIPADDVRVAWRGERWDAVDEESFGEPAYHHGFSVRAGGIDLDVYPPDSQFYNRGEPGWSQARFSSGNSSSLGPGEVTVELRFNEEAGTTDDPDGDPEYGIDAISLFDDRFDPNWQDAVTNDLQILGDTVAGTVDIETADSESIEQIVGGSLVTTPNDTGGDFGLALSNDAGSSYPITGTNTDAIEGQFDNSSTNIRARFTLGGYNSGNGQTPIGRDTPQEIDSYELFVDLDDTPFVEGSAYDGSVMEVLQELAENHGFIFGLEWDSDAQSISVEWTRPGQREASTAAAVLDYETGVNSETLVESGVVYGRSRRVRDQTVTLSTGDYVEIGDGYIQPGTQRVADPETNEVYQVGDDYEMRFNEGSIAAVNGGSIADGQDVVMDYETRLVATYELPSADGTRDTIRRTVEAASTEQLAEQAAIALVQELSEPREDARVVLDRETGFSLVGAINVEGAPVEPQIVREIEPGERKVTLHMGNRQLEDDVVEDIRRRVRSVARRL